MGSEDRTAPGQERLTVVAAAAELGTTVDAIRKRVQRGTIPHERDDEGRVWILLDTARTRQDKGQDRGRAQSERDELISRLEDEVRFLREELARKDAIMLRMAESLGRELEAPSEPRESPEPRSGISTPPEGSAEAQESSERPDSEAPRSWWRRMFGG